MDDFFRFSKNLGFWVFLVHTTVVSVLLSASVERCFVSRMRDFLKWVRSSGLGCRRSKVDNKIIKWIREEEEGGGDPYPLLVDKMPGF